MKKNAESRYETMVHPASSDDRPHPLAWKLDGESIANSPCGAVLVNECRYVGFLSRASAAQGLRFYVTGPD